jgi:hypothetical protein
MIIVKEKIASNPYESHIKNCIPIIFWESIGKFLKLDGNTMGIFLGTWWKYQTLLQNISLFHCINSTQQSFNIELA